MLSYSYPSDETFNYPQLFAWLNEILIFHIGYVHKALDAFVQQVEHPELKMREETQRHGKPRKLADCVGFIGIHERVQSGSWSTEDV